MSRDHSCAETLGKDVSKQGRLDGYWLLVEERVHIYIQLLYGGDNHPHRGCYCSQNLLMNTSNNSSISAVFSMKSKNEGKGEKEKEEEKGWMEEEEEEEVE